MKSDQTTRASAWTRLARRTAWKVNFAWIMQWAAPSLVIAGAVGFAVILWSRSRLGVVPANSTTWGVSLAVMAVLASVLLARRHFISASEAMVRLESELRLHNALSAAAAGCGAWPEVPSRIADGWQWNWLRAVGPPVACAAMIVLALHLPVSPDAMGSITSVEPQSWSKIESWLDKLEEEKIITPEEKAEQEARIQNLRDQPRDKWFSHESLNASDTLKDQLQRDIHDMGKNFDEAARSLSALENYADQLSTAAKDKLVKDFDEAVSGLKSSPLDIDPDLMKQLGQMDLKNLKSLSNDELKKLRDALKKDGEACKGLGEGKGFLGDGEGEDDEKAMMEGLLKKQRPGGEGDGEGDGPGNGGISRGPGTAPLTLSDDENRLDTDKNQGLANPDLSRAQLGATLGLKDGKHEVDKTPVKPTDAGKASNTGEGGAQIWRESLTPEEKSVLKKAFK